MRNTLRINVSMLIQKHKSELSVLVRRLYLDFGQPLDEGGFFSVFGDGKSKDWIKWDVEEQDIHLR